MVAFNAFFLFTILINMAFAQEPSPIMELAKQIAEAILGPDPNGPTTTPPAGPPMMVVDGKKQRKFKEVELNIFIFPITQ